MLRPGQTHTIRQVLLAWAVGLAIAGVIYGPIIEISQGQGWSGALRGLMLTPLHMVLSFTMGALISLPLVALGIVAGLIVGAHPGRHPLLWAIGCAVVGSICYGLGDALVRGDLWPVSPSFSLRPTHPVLIADMTIVAIAVFGGSLFYCLRLRGDAQAERPGAINQPGDGPPRV